MYLPESETIAARHPELETLIAQIDAFLAAADPAALLRANDYATHLSADHNQVISIFELFEQAGAITAEKMVECDSCQTLMPEGEWLQSIHDEEALECTSCGNEFGLDAKHIIAYRPSHTALMESASHKAIAPPVANEFLKNEDLPVGLLDNVFQHTPLLHYYSNSPNLKIESPFAGKRVLIVLHFLRDLLPFVEGMERLGLEPQNATFFYKSYPYPQKDGVEKWLTGRGYRVRPRSDIDSTLEQLARTNSDAIGRILIIEDGGFFVPLIHAKFPNLIAKMIGAVEQTTRGVMNCQDWLDGDVGRSIAFPVLSVATSQLKGSFEPRYIGRAVLQNIESLTGITLTGKQLALLGYGTIGREIVEDARNRGVNVRVFDLKPDHQLAAQQAGLALANTAADAVANAHVVIGASGRQSIGSAEIARMAHRTYVVSASSEDYEIDLDELRQQSRSEGPLRNSTGEIIGTRYVLPPTDRHIELLANGYPINFWGMNSMPDEAADLILTLILLAAVELACGKVTHARIDSAAINEIAANYEVSKKFLEFHQRH